MSSRPPSIYCDAFETPPRDIDEGPSNSSSSHNTHAHAHSYSHPTAQSQLEDDGDPLEQDTQVENMDQDESEVGEQFFGGDDAEDGYGEAEAARQRTVLRTTNDDDSMDVDEEQVVETDASLMDHAPSAGTQDIQSAMTNTTVPCSVAGGSTLDRRNDTQLSGSNSVSLSATGSGSNGNGQGSSTAFASASRSESVALVSTGKTVTVPTVDEKAQSELRRKIMDIQRDPTISFADKAGMIQKLMSSRWQGSKRQSDSQNDGSVEATEDDLKKTYYTIQEAAQSCRACNNRLAVYYCDVCKLWDDDPKKTIYHCDDCGICRIGKGLGRDYFHCKKCNICMNIQLQDNHKCIERNLECDCPICGEYMFTSTSTVIFMALGDMSAYYSKIDSLLAEQTMPPEYANIFSIVLCNDCEVKSEAPYHFLYHKCDKCHGYNTKVLETFKRVSDGQVQVVENATAAGAAGTVPENNLSGSSNSLAGSSSSPSSGLGVGPSSSSGPSLTTAAGASASTARVGLGATTPINLANVAAPRSPLMDENASGDMTMAGISGNSAP
ncbi:hypothetical protein BGX28_008463 [Mortierella sp. GBA30]|nr:hypothetical protein BGX28_008463 [Mortierella sp. GBA30]